MQNKIINLAEEKQRLEAERARTEKNEKVLFDLESSSGQDNFNHQFYKLVDEFMRETYPDYAWRFDIWLQKIKKPDKKQIFQNLYEKCCRLIYWNNELDTPDNDEMIAFFESISDQEVVSQSDIDKIKLFCDNLQKQLDVIKAQKQFAEETYAEEKLLISEFSPSNLNK